MLYGVGLCVLINIIKVVKVMVLMNGCDFVILDDVKLVLLNILRYCLILFVDLELEGVLFDEVISVILVSVEVLCLWIVLSLG